MRTLFLLVVMAAPLAGAQEAEAQATESKTGSNLFVESTLVGTIQRTGGILDVRFRWRKGLYDSKEDALTDNYVGAGVIEQATPIFSQTGAYVELQPASFFRLTGAYELIGYFGAFNTMRHPEGCDGVHVQDLARDDSRCAFPLDTNQKGNADYGHRVWVEALSQAKLGRFFIADNLTVERWFFRENWAAGAATTHWVNEMFNLPQRRDDLVITNDAQVLFEFMSGSPRVLAGFVSDLAYSAGTDYRTHRVGAMAMVHVPEWRGLRDLAAVLLVQFYTHDRYTTGPMPFIGLALTISTPNFMKGL